VILEKVLSRGFLVLSVMVFVAAPMMLCAAEPLGIAKINLEELSATSKKVEAAMQGVREVEQEIKRKIDELGREAEVLDVKLRQGGDTLKPEEKAKLQAELRGKVTDLGAEREAARTKITQRRRAVDDTLRPEITKAINAVAKSLGLKLVVTTRAIAYSADDITDITDKVIQALDSGHKPPAEAAQPQKKK
jgi:Skp family chaperone for outer membrane proteins